MTESFSQVGSRRKFQFFKRFLLYQQLEPPYYRANSLLWTSPLRLFRGELMTHKAADTTPSLIIPQTDFTFIGFGYVRSNHPLRQCGRSDEIFQ
jgi:hypothetical protein